MQLDSFTVLVAGCTFLIFLGLTYIYFWVRDRSTPALLWWGIPLILGGAALTLYARPTWEFDYLSISLGNAVRMLAIGCLWEGLRVFHERKPLLWPLAVAVSGWMVLCLMPGFADHLLSRVVVASLINGTLCFLAAHELWRGREEVLQSRTPLIAVFVSFGTIMLLRAALAGVTPFPFGAQAVDPIWLGGFMLAAFVHSTFAAFLFISLIRERREATQRTFAMSDPLTGLMNRRAFTAQAERSARRRGHQPVSLLVLDIDRFKSVNDRFGHETGDRMLAAFAAVAEASVRPTDQLFRMGGEEFCFVLPDTNQRGAIEIAERIRKGFELIEIASPKGNAQSSVSVGVASADHTVDLELLLAAADAAVYEAKARGRNRVVLAEPGTIPRPALTETEFPERRRA